VLNDLSGVRTVWQRVIARAGASCRVLLRVVHELTGAETIMAETRASEELLAAPLPDLIKNLGTAVAVANKDLRNAAEDMRFTIPSAEIELKVAISVDTKSTLAAQGGLQFSVFTVNASYARTYGFKEEASSVIKLTLAAVPVPPK
jgi:hypothetical protein